MPVFEVRHSRCCCLVHTCILASSCDPDNRTGYTRWQVSDVTPALSKQIMKIQHQFQTLGAVTRSASCGLPQAHRVSCMKGCNLYVFAP
jgi:hypothetical protein